MSTSAAPRDRGARERLAASLKPAGRAIIAGRPVAARDARVFKDISPVDGQSICAVARCSPEDVATAVSAALDSFERGTPFDGLKLSGSGRDRSPHASDKYCDLQTIWRAYA